MYQKGHKKCSARPPKKHAHSSDKDPDYIDESEESTMGSAENQKEEVNLFDDSDDGSKCGKNNNKVDDSKFHGVGTIPNGYHKTAPLPRINPRVNPSRSRVPYRALETLTGDGQTNPKTIHRLTSGRWPVAMAA